MIKEFYIGSVYACECQKCHKEVHGKDAFMHHKTSRTKKGNMANLWGTEKGDKEVKKTILLCKECHNALHSKYGKKVTHKMTKEFLAQ